MFQKHASKLMSKPAARLVNRKNGVIEFYAHAIPYLASTRKRNIAALGNETVGIAFPDLNINDNQSNKIFFLKENLRIPRGPDC